MNLPALDQFPCDVWGKLVSRHARAMPRSRPAPNRACNWPRNCCWTKAGRSVSRSRGISDRSSGASRLHHAVAPIPIGHGDERWTAHAPVELGCQVWSLGHRRSARSSRRFRGGARRRRHILIASLPGGPHRLGADAGMHVVALLSPGIDDVAASRSAAIQGIAALPLSTCYVHRPDRGGLVLGYGGATLHQIRDGVRRLKASLP